ncbi:hypothetical protein MRX96_036518 [Rhipicephalus microplus]
MRTERRENIDVALSLELGAIDKAEAAGRQGQDSAHSLHHLDSYRGLATSGLSLTQIIRVRRRTEARKPPGQQQTDKQPESSRSGGARPEKSSEKLLETVDTQLPPRRRSKTGSEGSSERPPEVTENPAESPFPIAKQRQSRRRSKIEDSSEKLPEVTEHSAHSPFHEDRLTQPRRTSKAERKGSREKLLEVNKHSAQSAFSADKQTQPRRRSKAEREGSSEKLPEVTEHSAHSPFPADKQTQARRRSSASSEKLPVVTEYSEHSAFSADKQQPRRRSKAEREGSSEKLPEVTEHPAQSAFRADKQTQPRRRSKAEHNGSSEKLHVVTEHSAQSPLLADKQHLRRRSKAQPQYIDEMETKLVELPVEPADHAHMQQPFGKSKVERKDSFVNLAVVEVPAESAYLEEAKESRLSYKGAALEQEVTGAEGPHVSKAPDVKARKKSVGGKGRDEEKPGYIKGDEVTESSSGAKERRTSESRTISLQKKLKKSAPESDATEKTIAEGCEKGQLKELSSSTSKRRGSTKKSETQESGSLDSKGAAVLSESPEVGKKHAPGGHSPKDGVNSPPEGSGKSIPRTKSRVHVIPFERRLSTNSASKRLAVALRREDTNTSSDGLNSRSGSPEEATTKKTTSLSSTIKLKRGPGRALLPVGDNGESANRRKRWWEKEGPPKAFQEADCDGKTQERGSPESRKQYDEKLPKGKRGRAKEKSWGHAHKHQHQHGRKHHLHEHHAQEHHKHKEWPRKGNDEAVMRCVETQTCLVSPVVEKGGASCRDFNFGINLTPVISGTLRRPSDKKRSGGIRKSSKDAPQATNMTSESPELKSLPTDGRERKERKSKFTGSPLSDVSPAEDMKLDEAGGVGDKDKKAVKDESPERSNGKRRSKKNKEMPSKRLGKRRKKSPRRSNGKSKFKRKSRSRGKSSSTRRSHKERSPEHGEQASSPEGPSAKKKGEEKAAAVESTVEQGVHETGVDMSRRPSTEAKHEQQELVSRGESKSCESRGEGRRSKRAKGGPKRTENKPV